MLDTVTQVELDKDATESLDTTQIQIQTRVKEQDTMCCYTCLNGCIHHQSPRYSCRYYRYRYRQKTGSKTPDTVTQIELAQDSAEALDTAVDINSNQGLVRGYYAPLDVTLVLDAPDALDTAADVIDTDTDTDKKRIKMPDTVAQVELAEDASEALDTAVDTDSSQDFGPGHQVLLHVSSWWYMSLMPYTCRQNRYGYEQNIGNKIPDTDTQIEFA